MSDGILKILAIDDNQDNLITVEAVVGDAFPNAQILTALDGQQGLALARQEDPDVILLDILMPGMDGYEVCRQLKAEPNTSAIPVIILTALKGDRQSRLRALQVGAEGFLSKPIDEMELTAQIQAMAKIKAMNVLQRKENENLGFQVEERTAALERELEQHRRAEQELREAHQRIEQSRIATLNLLEDLKDENEARRHSENALRLSETKFRALIENNTDAIVLANAKGVIQYESPAYERMMGYREHDRLGKYALETVHPDDRKTIIQLFDDLAQRPGEIQHAIFRNQREDGSWCWLEATAKNLLEEPAVGSIVVNLHDITERKQSEAERTRNQERLESLANILQHPYQELHGFLDYALHEAIRLSRSKIGYIYFYDEDTQVFELDLWSQETVAECQVADAKTNYLLKDTGIWGEAVRQRRAIVVNDFTMPNSLKKGYPEGHVHLERFLTVPVFSGERIVAVVGVANKTAAYDRMDELQLTLLMDGVWKVVERTRTAEELAALNQRMQHYVEASPVVLFAFEFTSDDVRLNWTSENTERLLGYSFTEMQEKHWWHSHVLSGSVVDLESVNNWQDTNHNQLLQEYQFEQKNGGIVWVQEDIQILRDAQGQPQEAISAWTDITERKQMEAALESRLVALTRPLEQAAEIEFEDLFDLAAIQRLQDEFSMATGVASVITHPDGSPITRPSNICRLCFDVIRKTEQGQINCFRSDAALGRYHPEGPVIQPCLSGGLWDAGANISVGGHHIANWLVGQVRDDTQTEEQMRENARAIGADENEFVDAFREVPFMPQEQFKQVAQTVFTLAGQLSNMAYQNVQQARFITERIQAEEALRESEVRYRTITSVAADYVFYSHVQPDGSLGLAWAAGAFETMTGYAMEDYIAAGGWRAHVYHEDLAQDDLDIELLRKNQQVVTEIRTLKKDGSLLWVEISALPVMDKSGKELIGIYGSVSDITERKQADAVLRESEERYRTVVSSAGEAFILQERSGAIVTWNQAAERIFGLTPAEALGQTSTSRTWATYREDGSFLPGEEHPSMITFATGQPCRDVLMKVVRDDDTFSWVTVSTNPVFFSGEDTPDAVVITVQDITARRAAQAAVQERERELSALMDNLPGMAYRSKNDADWTMTFVSQGSLTLTGYLPEDLVDNKIVSFLSLVHPDDIERTWQIGQAAIVAAQPFTMEYRIRDAAGTERWVWERGSGVIEPDGTVKTIEGFIIDITERKRANEALIDSENRFKTIFEQAPLGMALTDSLSGHIDTMNTRFAEIIGRSMEELAVTDWADFTHPEDLRADLDQMALMNTGKINGYQLEKRFIHLDGTIVWVNMTIARVTVEDETHPRHLCMIEDITERKGLDQVIIESENRFRLLYEQSPGPYQSLDEQGMILEVNRAWLDELGYVREEVIGNWFGVYLSDHDCELFPQRFERFKRLGEVHGVEFEMLRKDGRLIDVSFEGRIVRDDQGRMVQTHCVFNNITEQKRIQATIRQYADDLNKAQAVAHVGSWKWHVSSNRLEWSDEMYTIFGIDKESFTGDLADVIARAIHPDDRAAVDASNTSVSEKGKPIPLEYRVIHTDGSVRTVWAEAGDAEHDEEGNILVLTGIVQDITERKAAETSLRDSEEKFSMAFQNSPYAITITEPRSGHFIDVNPAFTAISGYTREETLRSSSIGMDIWVNQSDRKDVLRKMMKGKKVASEEFQFCTKGGRIITGLFTADIIQLNDVPYVLSSIEDITERKAAEAQLLLQDAALQAAANGIVITDLDAVIQWANPAFTELTGYTLAESIGKNPRDLLKSGMHEKAYYQEMWDTILAGKVWRGEFINRRKDGTLYNEHEIITPILNAAGKITSFIAIKEDISLRKQHEQRLQHQAHIQERLVAMGRALGATMDINIIYRTAYRYVREIVDVPSLGICLLDPDDKMLHAVFAVIDRKVMDVRPFPILPYTPDNPDTNRSRVIATQQPIIANDLLEKYEAGVGILMGENDTLPRSAIYVPMTAEGKSIGVMDLQSYDKDVFTEETGEWLSVVANQVALAIQNTRLYEQIRKRVAQLTGLREIDTAINAHLPLADIFHLIMNQAQYHFNVDAADILLLDSEKDELYYQDGFGFEAEHGQLLKIPLGFALPGISAQLGKIMQHTNQDKDDPVYQQCTTLFHEEFGSHIAVPLKVNKKVRGILEVFHRSSLSPNPEWLQYLETLAGQAAIAIDSHEMIGSLQETAEELLQAYDATIEGWSQAMDLRDRETEGHTQRVTELTLRLAQAAGVSASMMAHVRRGALLHDIGKLGVPDSILLKPGPLDAEEWLVMKHHPQMAYDMLKQVDYLAPALDIPHYHHEWWDGSGYPNGLSGEQIPLTARIFAIVDVWDAVTNERPYKAAWSAEKALKHIRQQSGSHFDPALVELFIALLVSGDEQKVSE